MAEEELEALVAVYGEDISLVDTASSRDNIERILSQVFLSHKLASLSKNSTKISTTPSPVAIPNTPQMQPSPQEIQHFLYFMARPRGETTSTSFVEASFNILLPTSYPYHPPIVHLDRISGLSDDGKALQNAVQRFLHEHGGSGEPILFTLVDIILDQLDRSNNGECMICFESLLSANSKKKDLSTHPVSLRTICYHCFHVRCLCRWACQFYDQMNDQQAKVLSEQQNLSLRSFQGEVKTSETQLKKSQDEHDLIKRHIDEIQSKINSFGTVANSQASVLEDLRQQFTQLNLQVSKASGKKKQKLLEALNILKNQIQAEERRQEDPQSSSTHDPIKSENDQWADNDMTLPELEDQLRIYKSQLPEAERKLKRCQNRLANATEEFNLEVKRQETKLQEEADNWSQIPFPCPCCRTPLQDCLPSDPHYFQQCLHETYRQYQSSSFDLAQSITQNVLDLPIDLQEFVRDVQRKQAEMKLHQHSWVEVENITRSSQISVDENPSAPFGTNSRNGHDRRRVDTAESKERRNPSKQSRLQDKRYEHPRPHDGSSTLKVSDMIESLPSTTPVIADDDADMQEAIRLSLLDIQSKNSKPINERKRETRSEKKSIVDERKKVMTSPPLKLDESKPPTPPTILEFEEEKRCLICDDLFDREEHLYAFGSCDHACICGICAFRSRCILGHNICVMCRTPLDVMICSESAPDPRTPFSSFSQQYQRITQSLSKEPKKSSKKNAQNKSPDPQLSQMDTPTLGKHIFHEESKMYIPRLYLKETLSKLMCFRCRSCGEVFDSNTQLRQLKSHLQSHNLYLCEVCFTERKIFPSEMNVYTAEELQRHFQCGDPSLGTRGHPVCTLCDRRFYDNDKLVLHMMDDHHQCFICKDREGEGCSNLEGSEGGATSSGSYFKNAQELQEHFKRAHYLCKQCKKVRVVSVFETELALTEHIQRSHLVMGLRYR